MNVPTTSEPTPTPPRRRSAIARAVLALVASVGLIAGATALPASASPPPAYAGLGDSVAAGTGGSTYVDLTCLRTAQAYPTQLGGANGACAGATTADVPGQAAAAGVNSATKNITITVGANDVGARDVAIACLPDPSSTACTNAIAASTAALKALPASLTTMISAVRQQAPRARITLTGYPLLFTVWGLPAAQQQIAAQINLATASLNTTIGLTALSNGALYTDVTWRFLGHGIGSPQPWIHTPGDSANPADAFHPNNAGYTYGYVPAVRPFVG